MDFGKKRKRGQPPKSWEEKGEVAKRKDIYAFSETLMDVPREKLLLAVARVVKQNGDKDLADILEFVSANKTHSTELMTKIKMKIDNVNQISPQNALAMLFDANLGKSSFIAVQRAVNSCGKNVVPCYDRVRQAKTDCLPAFSSFSFGDTFASVKLAALLEHTARRILEHQKSVFLQEKENLTDRILTISLRRRAIVRKRKTLPTEVIALLDETECGLTPVPHDEYNMTELPDAVEENLVLESECGLLQ
ncbi:unnamed protein product [Allacma fusca]|uniref:Uncharacterized protein n=1 Tax=Allacma fusca TaxID=39272 RepID=A0A8J2JA56_9HEXA|nr:unnamed protein product [Allacma fusca]